MSSEVFVVTKATANPGIENMTADLNQDSGEIPAIVNPPIEFFTENGFCIVRISDLLPATPDSVSECRFLLRHPDGEESEVVVGFDERAIAQVQRQRHNPLSDSSPFWLSLAEDHLATYVWNNNQSPATGRLVISHLSGPHLSFAASWID